MIWFFLTYALLIKQTKHQTLTQVTTINNKAMPHEGGKTGSTC